MLFLAWRCGREIQILKGSLSVGVAILVTVALFTGCVNKNESRQAPGFDITLYGSEDYELGDSYNFNPANTSPLILNFWFPSCPPCVAEMPEINSIYERHKTILDVVGIQLVGLDSIEDGEKFVAENRISYAVGADLDGQISVDYGVSVFPTTIFVSHEGKIIRTWQGMITETEIGEIMESELNISE